MVNMDDQLFNLKFTTKQMERLAKKADKEQKIQLNKVKKAIADKDTDTAKIYAENAIRKKNESLNYRRLSARIDAVASKVQTALTMKQVIKNMDGVSKSLTKAMDSMDLEKVTQIMSKFETQFEDLDVRTSTIEGAMGTATTLSTPEDQVQALIRQVAEENQLEVTSALKDITPGSATLTCESISAKKEDDLTLRLTYELLPSLAQLRN